MQHCSNAQPSLCTLHHIRAYFQNGTLPPEGTVCAPDMTVWGKQNVDRDGEGEEDLAAAMEGLEREVDFSYMAGLGVGL